MEQIKNLNKPIIIENEVHFWRPSKEKNGEFSNFYQAEIVIEGKKWKTNEHYFQAQKFAGESKEETIRKLNTPLEAFRLGRKRDNKFPLRSDWEIEKDNVMYLCCMEKFSQHENLKQFLLDTGSAKIIEASPLDSYWGWGRNKLGKNKLGEILMKVRAQLQKQQNNIQQQE